MKLSKEKIWPKTEKSKEIIGWKMKKSKEIIETITFSLSESAKPLVQGRWRVIDVEKWLIFAPLKINNV